MRYRNYPYSLFTHIHYSWFDGFRDEICPLAYTVFFFSKLYILLKCLSVYPFASEADFVIVYIPAAAALADELVDVLDTDLFAVFVEGLARHRGVLHALTFHLDKAFLLSIIQEEVFQVVFIIVSLGHYNFGIAENSVHVLAMQALLVEIPVVAQQ